SIPASGTTTYPQAYAPTCPRISVDDPILSLANRFDACSNNQVDAVFGSKHGDLRIEARRTLNQNHGAPDTSVSGAYPFLAPRQLLAGAFFSS
ncbi:MAG: hypothetical protein ABIR87_07620, partial [Sphingomicrobium sp.]